MLRNVDKALRADGPYSSEPVNATTLRVFVPKRVIPFVCQARD